MVFSSAPFLFIFLPVVFVLHTLIRNITVRNILLVLASLIFYGYGEPVYMLLMVGSVAVNYLLGRGVAAQGRSRKICLVLAILWNVSVIGIFKYTGFIIKTINDLCHTKIADPQIALPIGISFFTFQIMSYVIDTYRDADLVQKNAGKLLLYVSFFPQLVAGPIVKYHDVRAYIDDRNPTADEVAAGLRRFIFGLSKKMFIANSCGAVADAVYSLSVSELSTPAAWIGAAAYLMQIYFDFSGYSDMAIGMGHMFGFTFLENFTYPYCASSIREFWRRWHISLSTWFKEYLYIPLGGNRKGRLRTYLNKYIVFFTTGLWHGANWTFVLWGLIHGTAMVLEDMLGRKIKRVPSFVGFVITIFIVLLAFALFRADTVGYWIGMLGVMFVPAAGGTAAAQTLMTAVTPYAVFMFVLAVIFCFPVVPALEKRCDASSKETQKLLQGATYVISFGLLLLCVFEIAASGYNPFIYFRF